MENVDQQLKAAVEFSKRPGNEWYRIVYSAAEARKALADGVLAVVLGIEVDNLFGCGRRSE